MKIKFNIKELNILQYILLNEQCDLLDSVKDFNYSCDLNYLSLFLSHLYKKITLMKKELEKNG